MKLRFFYSSRLARGADRIAKVALREHLASGHPASSFPQLVSQVSSTERERENGARHF